MAAETYTLSNSLTKVLAQLGDESVPIRSLSLSYLSDLPRSETDSFRSAWNGFSAARRFELVGAMVEQAEANIHVNFHAVLRESLHDADAQVRQLVTEIKLSDALIEYIVDVIRARAHTRDQGGQFRGRVGRPDLTRVGSM